jgi:hypothetical protein
MPRQRKPNDLSPSLIALDLNTTLIAVVELSLSNWLVAGIVPGVERQPLKKLKPDENALLTLLNRWRDEAVRSGHKISRIAVARHAEQRLETLRTPEGEPIPANTLAELKAATAVHL